MGRTSRGVFVAVESEGRVMQFFLTEIVARLMGFWAPTTYPIEATAEGLRATRSGLLPFRPH